LLLGYYAKSTGVLTYVGKVDMGFSDKLLAQLHGRLEAMELRWSPLFGQIGGLIKLFPGSFYAASLMDIVSGACPGYGAILSTR
jgi:hypothetical protein